MRSGEKHAANKCRYFSRKENWYILCTGCEITKVRYEDTSSCGETGGEAGKSSNGGVVFGDEDND